MRRRWLWLTFLVTLLIIGIAGVTIVRSPRFQKWYEPPALTLPADDEVAELRASLHASDFGFEETSEFVVPPEGVPCRNRV